MVAESAFNDPTGAVLALAIAGALVSGKNSLTGPAGDFVGQLVLSTAGGVLAGVVLSAAISSRRTGIWRESSAIAVLAVVAMSYVSLDFAGGSGYLGAFLAGLIVGNMKMLGLSMHDEHSRDLIVTTRSLADIVTIFVFVLVGANLPFHALGEEILPALAVVAVLLLVARPITVAICCLPDRRSRWSRAELAFVCWTRGTGSCRPRWSASSRRWQNPGGPARQRRRAGDPRDAGRAAVPPHGSPAVGCSKWVKPHMSAKLWAGPTAGGRGDKIGAMCGIAGLASSCLRAPRRPPGRCSHSSTTAAPTAPAWPSTATPRRSARARSRSSPPTPATNGDASATGWPAPSAATRSRRCARATRSSSSTRRPSRRKRGCARATPSCGS